jgi:hypothetical protein
MAEHHSRAQLIVPSASPAETAAIVAAVERFLRETAPPAPAASDPDPWLRAAILEGVSRQEPAAGRDPWINT